ncbi:CENP-C_C domain-containing protein [Trichonephila clavata]|uniref:CENP-C_C domain-containing protein n=1 Tax=Trichonephila clavata TaxID=2740835 RepID=A0A8X6KQV4_TRICU|nr:CENP-C_C domain-containing protein [Trichonephila clavata]
MKEKRKYLTSNIGRRSGLDVVSRKRIKAQEDGTHVFDDYWTDSDPDISKITNTSVKKVVTNEEVEEAARKSHSDALNAHKKTYDDELSTFLPDQRDTRVLKAKERLSASFAGSAKNFGKPITPKISKETAVNTSLDKSQKSMLKDHTEALRQEKSPPKPEQQHVRRGSSKNLVYKMKLVKSSSVSEEPSAINQDHPEQSPVKRRTRIIDEQSGLGQKKSVSKVRTTKRGNSSNMVIHNEEGPLQIKPSVSRKKRHANNSVKMSQKHASQTHSNLFQFKNDPSRLSSKRSPVKRKNSLAMYEQSPFGSEASFIESETSPKKITQVTEDQRNLSRQTKTSAKAKASKNKRATPVDNYEVQSDLGENSLPIVERKENKMTVSGKNNRQPHSEKSLKRTISHTHDKQSKDVISNGNTSGPSKGPRRSSRYRVPPLDSWRNERLVFKALPSGDVQCLGIDKGTEEDKYGLLKILSKAKKIKSRKEKLVKTVENTSILDTKTGGKVHAIVHRPFESLQWSGSRSKVKKYPPYITTIAFMSKTMSFGYLDVSPFSTKEAQYSPIYNLHFTVMKGIVDVTINETKFTLERGDSFIVPIGAPYFVKNCMPVRALLSFCIFKAPFFPHQFEE